MDTLLGLDFITPIQAFLGILVARAPGASRSVAREWLEGEGVGWVVGVGEREVARGRGAGVGGAGVGGARVGGAGVGGASEGDAGVPGGLGRHVSRWRAAQVGGQEGGQVGGQVGGARAIPRRGRPVEAVVPRCRPVVAQGR